MFELEESGVKREKRLKREQRNEIRKAQQQKLSSERVSQLIEDIYESQPKLKDCRQSSRDYSEFFAGNIMAAANVVWYSDLSALELKQLLFKDLTLSDEKKLIHLFMKLKIIGEDLNDRHGGFK